MKEISWDDIKRTKEIAESLPYHNGENFTDIILDWKTKAKSIVDHLKEHEEAFVKDILRKFLMRQPTIDDTRRTTRVFGDDVFKYTLYYLEIRLGIVQYNFSSNAIPISLSFIPDKSAIVTEKPTSKNQMCTEM